MDSYQITRLDQLIFFLSKDSFFDSWDLIGLQATSDQKKRLQQRCREVTDQILSGQPENEPQRYPYDLSEERRSETERLFFLAIAQCEFGTDFVAAIEDILRGPGSTRDDHYAVIRLHSLTDDIAYGVRFGRPPILSSELDQRVARIWFDLESLLPDLRPQKLESHTEWDNFLRELEPSFHHISGILRTRRIIRFWEVIAGIFSASERSMLVDWYVAKPSDEILPVPKQLTLPAWLK